MTTDFRALCAELVAILAERIDDKGDAGPYFAHAALLLKRARAALAEPEPEGPSLKEQALSALYAIATGADDTREFYQDIETIKTALEQLDD